MVEGCLGCRVSELRVSEFRVTGFCPSGFRVWIRGSGFKLRAQA